MTGTCCDAINIYLIVVIPTPSDAEAERSASRLCLEAANPQTLMCWNWGTGSRFAQGFVRSVLSALAVSYSYYIYLTYFLTD